jgi:hypothetical protein
VIVTAEVLQRCIVKPKPGLCLGHRKQQAGLKEVAPARLPGDCERSLEMTKRVGKLADQKMPLA